MAFCALTVLLLARVSAQESAPVAEVPPAPAPAGEAAPIPEVITLDTAIQRALGRNFTIKVQSFLVPLSEADVSVAKARFDPRLNFSFIERSQYQLGLDPQQGDVLPPALLDGSDYDLSLAGEIPWGLTYRLGASSGNPRGTFADPLRNDYDYYATNVGISARLPLLRGFGPVATDTSIRIARTDLGISEWEFRSTVINTVTDVIYSFNELLFAHANLRSARRSRELANGLFVENERRHQLGSMSEYDVLSARARVATREEGILLADRFVREAANRLKQLISDDTSAALLNDAFTLAPPPAPAEALVTVESDVAVALEKRPDYQQAVLSLERNEYNYRFYRNQLLPALDLVGSYGYDGIGTSFSASGDQISDRRFRNYTAGVTFSIPLTSAAERARYHSSHLARDQAGLLLRQLEQDIVVRLGNAAGQIETTWKRVLATRASRDFSQQALDAEVKKLRAGTGSTFVVLQLQEILATDEVREARSAADYRNALAEYDRQLGRTLETFHIDLTAIDATESSK